MANLDIDKMVLDEFERLGRRFGCNVQSVKMYYGEYAKFPYTLFGHNWRNHITETEAKIIVTKLVKIGAMDNPRRLRKWKKRLKKLANTVGKRNAVRFYTRNLEESCKRLDHERKPKINKDNGNKPNVSNRFARLEFD